MLVLPTRSLLFRPAAATALLRPTATSLLRPATRAAEAAAAAARHAHSIPKPRMVPREPSPSKSTEGTPKSEGRRPAVPQGREGGYYQLSFTCVPCGHRSHHNVSKQGYHAGSTLITCPECRNRHVISDHLGILTERKGVTIEDIVREKGQLVKRGTLGEDGDIEFWPDETDAAADTTQGGR
ncbi:mitochondrial protein import protein ZIM17 [Geosmithia morbida]|uniref:Mitochondrial protein import protein ZIM17 n=1 Tax=Geosmithia morbida TaxID=1094350 RepID=A0A9P4YYC0_9HYPO|nr:mitochondrial protein import protein ZIM17 [Geosmithia morbida]KAF4123928.1 mitochondrial protein import protein ZIM17 [Geosmithia morbida]